MKLIDTQLHEKNNMKKLSDIRLAMTILARDEADIIEDNIRFHASAGVDKFVVTDNASLDGTREILEKLSKEFDVKIFDEPSHTIDQDRWVSRMADWLKENNACDLSLIHISEPTRPY